MIDCEYAELVELHWQGKTKSTQRKTSTILFSTTSQSKVQNQAGTDSQVNVFGEIIAY